ncbi:MAG: DUF342 domain-containing protein [Lachnospiraceae bacterium]|nr:DUF342 domain-containing protein [Lachnospiraceae bacterium]
MAKRNGFFRLQIEEHGVYIQLVPPSEGGEAITISDVMDYLGMVKITEYDLNGLNRVLIGLHEPTRVKLLNSTIEAVNEKAKIQVSADKMSATIRLYAPSNKGKTFTKQEIIDELQTAGVKFGIIEKVVNVLVATPLYCHDIVIAKGKAVTEGSDARIEYHFETQPLAKPKLNEDGTVDFHQLNIFTRVEKGQLLATLIPENLGEPGMDVLGNSVAPHKIKKAMLKCGRNIHLSEDHLQMFSDVDGDVKLEGDTVFVSDSYTVAADVDASTGDIVYDGNVIVNGNVRTGFSIHAKGDIQVKGVVEGADLYAGGNIVLSRGIQGMNRGKLEAQGDIITKFIESATVKAGGNVRSGSILHSNIDAGDTILCEGRKSFVIGGNLSARNLIDVKTMGNQMGTITNVKIGIDASVLDNLKAMEEEYAENIESIDKCKQVLVLFKKRLASGQKIPPDKVAVIQAAGNDKQSLEARQEELEKQIEETKLLLESSNKGRLKVSDTIHSGVRIMIGNSMYVVKDELKYCQFHIRGGEIVSDSYL